MNCTYNIIRVIIMFKVNKNTKKTEHRNKTFRFPAELVEKLQIIAQQEDVSLNKLVIQCCQYAMENFVQDSK